MSDPLSAETLARMKRDHQKHPDGCCATCKTEPYWGEMASVPSPCDAAMLLAEMERYVDFFGPMPRTVACDCGNAHCHMASFDAASPGHDG